MGVNKVIVTGGRWVNWQQKRKLHFNFGSFSAH
jgi:hypothetical protein